MLYVFGLPLSLSVMSLAELRLDVAGLDRPDTVVQIAGYTSPPEGHDVATRRDTNRLKA